jgi:hypothetical protein
MKLNEFFDQLEITEAPKKFPEGHYTHTPGALEVMPTQDQTLWADAGELPKKFNVTKMKIAIYDEQDDEYSYGNGGLLVYHNAGTWKMYTDDVTRVQIADYLGIANKDIDFSEQGMQEEEYMHFDIEDDAVAQLIEKGAFKLEESTTAKIKGIKEANNLEDRAEKMVLAKLKREYKGYESMVANARGRDDKRMYKDRLRDLGQMIKYVQGKTPFGIDTILEEEVAEMIEKAMAKLKGKGIKEAYQLDIADKKVLAKLEKEYEGYKSMWTNAKDLDDKKMYQERLRDLFSMIRQVKGEMKYGIDTALQDELSDMYDELTSDIKDTPMPRLLRLFDQPEITKALRKEAGFPESAYVYFDDADLVYGDKTVWPQCGVDEKCTFGDAVKALKKFAKNPYSEDINDILRLSGLK